MLNPSKQYNKNGFIEFDKHIFKLGNDEQTDLNDKIKNRTNPIKGLLLTTLLQKKSTLLANDLNLFYI